MRPWIAALPMCCNTMGNRISDFADALRHLRCGLIARRATWCRQLALYHDDGLASGRERLLLINVGRNPPEQREWRTTVHDVLQVDWELVDLNLTDYLRRCLRDEQTKQ